MANLRPVDAEHQALSEAEIRQDLADLALLVDDMSGRLKQFRARWATHPAWSRSSTRDRVEPVMVSLLTSYAEAKESLVQAKNKPFEIALATKKRQMETLHALQGIAAATLASADWQSPTFLHADRAQAGRETGEIQGTINDYKRDHHIDAERYEQAFAKAYIDTSPLAPAQCCAVSSGMAAFSTIVTSLVARHLPGPIFVGRGCYFENRGVLNEVFLGRVRLVDEHDIDALVVAVQEQKPSAIFLDTLCNDPEIAVPNLAALLPAISRVADREIFLVLDNTGLSVVCQPWRFLPPVTKIRLVVFESLNKFHQFGLDRVTGGFMWTPPGDPLRLFGHRMHLGTNIPEASALALPAPDRRRLERRLARFGRNAFALAEALDEHIRGLNRTPLSHVVYPGLPSHPAHAWCQHWPFQGTFFLLAFKPEHDWVHLYEVLQQLIIEEARKAEIEIHGGSSFGLDVTRVYVTAMHAKGTAKPFLRVAVGTETLVEMDVLAEVFRRAIDRLSSRPVYL